MDAAEQIKKFQEFIESEYHSDLLKAIRTGKKSLEVDFSTLSKFNIDLAESVLEFPEDSLKAAEIAAEGLEGKHMHIRIFNLPKSQNIMIREIRSEHINKFLEISGIIRQKSDVRPQVTSAKFECPSCGNTINVLQLDNAFKEPSRCGCGRKGKFRLLNKELVDAQAIILEESPEDIEGSEQPKRMNLFLKQDLVSPLGEKKTSPGSKVKVSGMIKEVPITLRTGAQSTRFDLLIECNHVEGVEEEFGDIEIGEEEEKEIIEFSKDPKLSEKLIKSVAPTIYGHDKIKEALIYQQLGGVRKERTDGVVTRGDIHVLLVGDPGCGKSQLIKRMEKVAPKARFVSGKGASGAGLTAAVVRDEFLKGWALEAGALVLANRGICMIDELDKMSNEDRSAMHEALEQQSFHHDTFIGFSDGSEEKIGEFVENLMIDNPERIIKGKDCFILPIKDKNIEMLTTNWENIFKTKIDRVSKHIAPKYFYKIKICNGREITVTPEHPVFYIENGEIKTVSADKLKEDMWIPVPLDCPITGEKQKFSILKEDYYNKRASQHISVPMENGKDFFKMVGYILAEGSKETNRKKLIGINFTNKDLEVLTDFEESMKKLFNLKPYKQPKKDDHDLRYMYRYISRELAEFVKKVIPTILERSNKKEIPSICMKGKKEDIAMLLSCMFEGDGHVSKKTRTIRIGFASNSRRMCEQVQDLLLRFRIRSNLTEHKKSYKVSITGYENIIRFYENISFRTKEKNKKIEEYIENKKPIRFVKDSIPTISGLVLPLIKKYFKNTESNYNYNDIKYNYLKRGHNIHRSFLQRILRTIKNDIKKEDKKIYDVLKKLAFGDVGFEKIKSIKKIKNKDQKWTYDVTIEPNHNFISQNLFLHNTVSISKANIQATLRTETTVLAAANPKFGRFDPYGIVADQINLPPALINRFDLIFPIKDLPSSEKDEKLAGFILRLHQDPNLKVELSTEFIRRYFAYAKQKIRPRMNDSALDELKDYFVRMRSMGGNEDGSVKAMPISARQLEALVRLSEAAAKLRLSSVVTKKDAKKAIELLEFCLAQVATDSETGVIDIDRISTGIPASQRNNIHVVREIINDLENKLGKVIPIDDIIKESSSKNVSEDAVEEVIEKLKRSGDIFEPKRGFISKI